jgi:hypothetical protein
MRRLPILLLLVGVALPSFAARRVTVAQLEQELRAARGKRDGKVADLIAGMELSERLTSTRLNSWQARLPGDKSRQSLKLLADLSAFLNPPASEIPALPTPNYAAQSRIMALAVDYTKRTLQKLPNFFARRDTVLFEDVPPRHLADLTSLPYQPIHAVSKSSEIVLYRDGKEVVDLGKVKRRKYSPNTRTLTTHGVFGPILNNTLLDAANGKLTWSHWEQGADRPEAVFRFSVPMEKSHYQVEFCCFLAYMKDNGDFRKIPAYHGEIAVDPEDGTILRLSLVADLDPTDPVGISNIMVEYGSVEIGGKSYICPVRSVSMWIESLSSSNDPQTLLNDVDFGQYHLFRSESRVLIGNDVIGP